MTTVGDTIEKVSRLRLKQAVWEEAVQYLASFIPTDSYVPKNGIASPIGGDFVPQDVVEEVKDELFVEVTKLEAQILELKGQAIGGAVKEPPAKKVIKRSPPKRRKPSDKQA